MGSEYVFLRRCAVCEGDMGSSSAFGGRWALGSILSGVSVGGEDEHGVWCGQAPYRVAHGGWVWNMCTHRKRPVIL